MGTTYTVIYPSDSGYRASEEILKRLAEEIGTNRHAIAYNLGFGPSGILEDPEAEISTEESHLIFGVDLMQKDEFTLRHFSIEITNMRFVKRDEHGEAHLTWEVPDEKMQLLEEILGTKLLYTWWKL